LPINVSVIEIYADRDASGPGRMDKRRVYRKMNIKDADLYSVRKDGRL